MLTHVPKLQLADPREQEDLTIEILIADDHNCKTVKDSPTWRISPSVVQLPSKLGWSLAEIDPVSRSKWLRTISFM